MISQIDEYPIASDLLRQTALGLLPFTGITGLWPFGKFPGISGLGFTGKSNPPIPLKYVTNG